MGFSYNKLWKLLRAKNMKKLHSQSVISTILRTMVKMGRDENACLETLDKICKYIQYDIGYRIEYKNTNIIE